MLSVYFLLCSLFVFLFESMLAGEELPILLFIRVDIQIIQRCMVIMRCHLPHEQVNYGNQYHCILAPGIALRIEINSNM